MSFGSGGSEKSKAWKDIWGCGQGIDKVKSVQGAGDLVAQYIAEYEAMQKKLAA
jgi:nitronate monooxygenase